MSLHMIRRQNAFRNPRRWWKARCVRHYSSSEISFHWISPSSSFAVDTTPYSHSSSSSSSSFLKPNHAALSVLPKRLSSSSSYLSPRKLAALEEQILRRLQSSVRDPILGMDIVRSLNWVRSIEFPTMTMRPPPTTTTQQQQQQQKKESSKTTEKTTTNPIEDDSISIHIPLRLPNLLHPKLMELKQSIESTILDELSSLYAKKKVHIDISTISSKPMPFVRNSLEREELIKTLGPGLANVAHYIAVYSCKGGVGKSTIAVNLAYELSRMGGRIGLLDVDVYGPSLPVLIQPDDAAVRRSPKGSGMIYPIDHEGVKVMSLGFVSPNSGVPGSGPDGGAAVMRGPMAGRVVTQLLKGTDWGDLDVLVLDLPPGTGDVQLSICQDLQLSGAVSVTTPSKLAITDAKKGIEMFTSLGVPTLAAVENMSFFECSDGTRHYPFGMGLLGDDNNDNDNQTTSSSLFQSNTGLQPSHVLQLPISIQTNTANDNGTPLCISRPTDATLELNVFETLANLISDQLFRLHHGQSIKADVSDDDDGDMGQTMIVTFPTTNTTNKDEMFDVSSLHLSVNNHEKQFMVRLFSNSGATQLVMDGTLLRLTHPKTGQRLKADNTDDNNNNNNDMSSSSSQSVVMVEHHKQQNDDDDESLLLFPVTLEKKGRYGYSVQWADGATIIYSNVSIALAVGGILRSHDSDNET